ncbi:hypothetical protein DUNSADRAFT_5011 [Dunaliella salina]|uniref:Uncharacterized protein n=1 Tax=Dunaliella salina TaxID=3046 RepID=A0ABQ7GQV4_DUNSA|nr:hypothetical protein DUNSADRAFT_5011 [Dunaliella salina]|eukprot:KAF5836989.1 hypothetical protein DUNSADRAFT_5011 [Dunaliella salina]
MCEITQEFVSALHEERELRSLNLSSNGLTGIDPSFSTLCTVTALDLSQNDLQIGTWVHTLAALPNLRWLDLRGNPVCRHPESTLWLRGLLPQLQTLNGCASPSAPQESSNAGGFQCSQYAPLLSLAPDHQQQEQRQEVLRTGSCNTGRFQSSQDAPLPSLVTGQQQQQEQQQESLCTGLKEGSGDQLAAVVEECAELRSQTARLQQQLSAVAAVHGKGVQLAEQKSAWREHLRFVQEQCNAAQQIMQVLVHRLSQQHTRLEQAEAQREAASAALAVQQHRAGWLEAQVQSLEGRCQQLREAMLKDELQMREGGSKRLAVGHTIELPVTNYQASAEPQAEPAIDVQGPLRSQTRDQALQAQAASIAQMQEQVKAQHACEAQLRVELSTACAHVAQLQDEAKEMHARQAQLKHELQMARGHEAQLQNEVTELHAQKARLQDEVLALRTHEAQLQVELDSVVLAYHQEKQSLEASREAEESLRQQVSQLANSLKGIVHCAAQQSYVP